jgi:hypothetical protein
MAGSRTLKLSILGDVDNLNKSLKTATTDVETFGDKVGKVGKVVGAAFAAAAAAAGAYAVKIGIDGVKAALEDEKAQRILALTLENTTNATKAQIAAVEDYVTEVALATGVTDDELRPALARLVRSTKDTEEAQKLLSLALDISSATGKPLEAISNSLAKAYDGNTNALGKLGLGIDQSILKTKDFNLVYENLRSSFAGFSEQEANTFQGRLDRLNVAFDEAKETIGFALLPILEKVITFINDNALPVINAFANAFGNEGNGVGSVIGTLGNIITKTFQPIIEGLVKAFNYVKDAIGDNLGAFQEFGGYISKYLAPIIGEVLGGALTVVGKIAGGVIDVIGAVIKTLNALISGAIAGINGLISAYNFVNNLFGGKDVKPISAPSITIPKTSSTTTTVPKVTVPSTSTISGVTAAAATASAATNNIVNGSFNAGKFRAAEAASMGNTTINLTVTGAFDREGTARTIVDTLNNSFYRGTGGGTNLQMA